MLVLGIETSCDETSLAILDFKSLKEHSLLAEEILSQTKVHLEYGGVVPELAAREHLSNLPLLYDKVIKDSGIQETDLDLIAVTSGPGLKGCLLMGLSFAQGLAKGLEKDLYAIHHIEGHILAPFLNNKQLNFPYLALVVSGGHTQIVQVEEVGRYKILGKTIDDAAGEAFDKSAHLLGFDYPGGPKLAEFADSISYSRFTLPKIMPGSRDFSFSGLKTAISLLIKENSNFQTDHQIKAELAYAIQKSIVDNLLLKLKKAVKETGINNIVLTGGVAANRLLRLEIKTISKNCFYPDILHCMDNAAMIALTAAARLDVGFESTPKEQVFARISL